MHSDQSVSVPGLLREHKKVAFIFSSAGKPIYCYGVDEERMTDVTAAAQAIISVGKSLGDPLRSMRCVCDDWLHKVLLLLSLTIVSV